LPEQVLRRLMQSNPEHVLATLLRGRHQYAEAEAVARQAMKLHKYSFKANLVLGTLLIDQGKWGDESKTTLQYVAHALACCGGLQSAGGVDDGLRLNAGHVRASAPHRSYCVIHHWPPVNYVVTMAAVDYPESG
jgi:hypothetical protein